MPIIGILAVCITDIRTRQPKKIRKRTDGPGGIKKTTDGHGHHLGIPWPSLAPAIFQTLMNKIFSHQIGKSVLVYLDDILVYSKTLEEYVKHLREVFEILKTQKFFCRLHKCHFNDTQMKYLGHLISSDGVRPDPEKVEKVKKWPRPTSMQEVRSVLGLANYFRKFMQGYSRMVSPLTDLTQSSKSWKWTDECSKAFEKVKYSFTVEPAVFPDGFSL